MAYTPSPNSTWAGVGSSFTVSQLGANTTYLSQYDLPPYEEVMLRATEGTRIGFTEMLKLYGFAKGTDTAIVGHAEVERQKFSFKFDQIVTPSGGAGLPMTVRIDAAYMASPINVFSGGIAAKASLLRKNDEFILPSIRKAVWVVDKITTGTQHTFVVKPKDPTVNLDTYITAGTLATTSYFVNTNSYPDGSNVGTGKTRDVRKYTNTFQIIKEQSRLSGGAASIGLRNINEDGVGGNVFKVHLEKTMTESYDRARNGALLAGEKNLDTTGIANVGLGQDTFNTGTEGFIPWVEKNGHEEIVNYAAYTLDNFRDKAYKYEQLRLNTLNFTYLHSHQAKSAIDKTILDKFDNTADRYLSAIYTEMNGTSDMMNFTSQEDYALRIGFKSVMIDNYTFTFKSMHEFNDVENFGGWANGYFNKYAIIAPLGFTTDIENQAQLPMFGYHYRYGKGGINRETVTSMWGGHMAAATPVNGDDYTTVALGCDIAFQAYCGNHFIYEHE